MDKSIFWYLERIRTMPLREVFHRINELLLSALDFIYFKYFYRVRISTGQIEAIKFDATLGSYLISNRLNILKAFGDDNEHCNYQSIVNENFFKFCKAPKGFDLRLYWEGQRFQNLILMSIDSDGDDKVREYLYHWMKHNKPLSGLNYVSTMECAIRIINLYATACVLEYKRILSKETTKIIFEFMDVNLRIISHRVSLYSSRGNHTLFEYAGILVASIVLSKNKLALKYSDIFSDEFVHQVNNDGSGVEQSTAYHKFNVELAILFDKFFDIKLNHFFSKSLEQSICFLSKFVCFDESGGVNYVRFGDSDSSSLFTQFLLNEKTLMLRPIEDEVHFFSDSGFLYERKSSSELVYKCGDLGMPPLFGHGHFDFLSISLRKNGKLVNCDSHTYLYNSAERSDIRSSRGHSMPCFRDDDIEQASAFSWNRNSSAEYLGCEIFGGYRFHLGKYVRQKDCTSIFRAVCLNDDCALIVDVAHQSIDSKSNKLNQIWLYLDEVGLSIESFGLDKDYNICQTSEDTVPLLFSIKYGEQKTKVKRKTICNIEDMQVICSKVLLNSKVESFDKGFCQRVSKEVYQHTKNLVEKQRLFGCR